MKKILITTLLSFNILNCFGAVATSDVYVMGKDTERAATTVSYYESLTKEAYDLAQNASTQGKSLDKLNTLVNNSSTIKKLCAGCSDVTIAQLEDWKNKNAANICEETNNQLSLVNGHITNLTDMNKFLSTLQSAMNGDMKDPSAYAKVGTAIASATHSTLTEMNQTQQQLASYNLQKDQKDSVDNKLAELQANKSMFGTTNVAPPNPAPDRP